MSSRELATIDGDGAIAELARNDRISTLSAEAQLAEIEAGMLVQSRLAEIALRMTTDRHWDSMGKKPRLNARGAKLVRQICHLTVETFGSVMVEQELDKDGRLSYFAYECKGRITSPWGPPMDCSGRCDSANQFHSTRYKDGAKIRLSAWEVNRVNIAQQAQTLCITRGVAQYMGLEGLEWTDVRSATGAQDGGAQIAYKDTAKKSAAPSTEDAPARTRYSARKDVFELLNALPAVTEDDVILVRDELNLSSDSRKWSREDAQEIKRALTEIEKARRSDG